MDLFARPMETLRPFDPELAALAEAEYQRQKDTLCLIVSENYASPYALALEGSILANKNAGGYPDSRGVGAVRWSTKLRPWPTGGSGSFSAATM